jgi:tetratricopeptide (TPR) repeat protein
VLLARLTNRLDLLRGGARDLPERQQTMRAAIAWSYNLLPPSEQRAFRMLGIFAGGCTLAALEAVGSESEAIDSGENLSAISTLVNASLVQMETMGAERMPRYRMLELIREYALEQLQVMSEEDDYRRRHAVYYAALAEQAEQGGPGQGSRELQLAQESANGRAAIHWAYERGEVELGLRLATWFGRLWMTRGQMREASAWLEQMLALDKASGEQAAPSIRAKALYWAARLAMHLGNSEQARARADEALTIAERTGDQADISSVLAMLGAIALAIANDDQAAGYFTESYSAARRADASLALGLALLNLGELARKRGDLAQATRLLEEALTHVRSIDLTWGIANILTLLGHLTRQQQDYTRARAYYRESLAIYQQLGNATYTAWCLEGIAAMACAEERYQQAARLSGAAAALRVLAQTPLPATEQDEVDKVILTARAELPEQIFAAEWQSGSQMSQAQAIAYTLIELLR